MDMDGRIVFLLKPSDICHEWCDYHEPHWPTSADKLQHSRLRHKRWLTSYTRHKTSRLSRLRRSDSKSQKFLFLPEARILNLQAPLKMPSCRSSCTHATESTRRSWLLRKLSRSYPHQDSPHTDNYQPLSTSLFSLHSNSKRQTR